MIGTLMAWFNVISHIRLFFIFYWAATEPLAYARLKITEPDFSSQRITKHGLTYFGKMLGMGKHFVSSLHVTSNLRKAHETRESL